MPIYNNIFKKHLNKHFVETGSYIGLAIDKAVEAGFQDIHSIELSEHYHQYCVNKFSSLNFVHLHFGNSDGVLESLINQFNEPITFWLDAHDSGGDTASGPRRCPLMQELEVIDRHPIKTHTLIIDDMRCWNKPEYDFDREDIVNFVQKINPAYKIEYENGHIPNDILVAYIDKT